MTHTSHNARTGTDTFSEKQKENGATQRTGEAIVEDPAEGGLEG
jgi:hypothetical protein